jgi:hypothetical protein
MPANYVLLERIELNASAASVTFANIPQTGYTDLKVVASTRSAAANAVDALYGRFNSSSTGYTNRILYGETTGVGSFSPSISYAHLGYGVGGNGTANTFSNLEIYIPNYTSSNNKSVSVDAVTETNAANTQAGVQSFEAALWSNSAAITSITFTQESGNNFVANSTFSLYGLAAVGTTPVIAPKATGGNITTDGTYWIHTFLTSGTFTPQTALTCDYLVVAGGAGGAGTAGTSGAGGGGGGAGGFRTGTSLSAAVQAYSITVGAGGAGGIGAASSTTAATAGSNSIFSTITSTGGGIGADNRNGGSGGSGGGARYDGTLGSGNTPSTSPSQGNNGGAGGGALTYQGGGGGGGASAVGGTGTGSNSIVAVFGGAGGAGTSNSYSGSAVVYAGGGGGGVYSDAAPASAAGAGGTGGGGAGSKNANATAGTTNLGGGGGAAGNSNSTAYNGGAGGSGIVIIRYTIA